MLASISEYKYGFNVYGGLKHAFILQGKNGTGIKVYVAVHHPNEILFGGTIRNYCILQRTQAVIIINFILSSECSVHFKKTLDVIFQFILESVVQSFR